MEDKEFDALRLRAAVCPGLEKWGSDTTHWNALRKCGNELRSIVSKGPKAGGSQKRSSPRRRSTHSKSPPVSSKRAKR